MSSGGWTSNQLKEILSRKFGSRHEKPCDYPEMVECTHFECQEADKCMGRERLKSGHKPKLRPIFT